MLSQLHNRVSDAVIRVISEKLSLDAARIEPGSDFEIALGTDGEEFDAICDDLEKEFNITLSVTDRGNVQNVGDLIKLIRVEVETK